jgi:hypothetical protein
LKLDFILTEQLSGDMTLETLALLQTAAAESEEDSEVSFHL